MKKKYINIVYKRLIGLTLTLAACSVVMFVANRNGYSAPGMGLDTDEEADYLNGLIQAGYSIEEVHQAQIEYEKEHHTGWYADDEPTPAQSQPAKTEQPKTTQKQGNTTKTEEPAAAPEKTYSHDHDSITAEAKEAFIAFTSDGQPNSCYLNIDANSTENVITGKELNATRTGKEDGKISFVDNGEVKYEWQFSNWQSEDGISIDLTADYHETDNAQHELSFKTSTLGDNEVSFTFQTGMPSTKLYLYSVIGNKSYEKYVIDTDDKGFATLSHLVPDDYIVSSVVISDERVEEVTEQNTPEEAVEEKETEPAPLPISEEVANNKLTFDDEPAIPPYVIPIVVGVFVIILICAGVVIFKFMR